MTREIIIEDLRGLGMTAKLIDEGQLYSTYGTFARKAGYPNAIGFNRSAALMERKNDVFKVLARGNHDSTVHRNTVIYVIESEDGECFLVGNSGLKIEYSKGGFGEMSVNLRKMSYDQLVEYTDEVIEELRKKAYREGYEQGRFDERMESGFDKVRKAVSEETPQEKRDRIVEQAKNDIEELKDDYDNLYGVYPYACYAEFIINKDKRTVVALLRGKTSTKIRAKGIAKCAPNDCFNVHIGKAIALRRALGLEVPSGYLNAPQPTKVRSGDIVEYNGYKVEVCGYSDNRYMDYTRGTCQLGSIVSNEGKIIDDSRDE